MGNGVETAAPTIVVIDDDAAVRHALRFMLEVDGFGVATFPDASSFLVATSPENPACLVVDHLMPGTTGMELSQTLRAKGSHVPIILVTSGLNTHMNKRANAIGIDRVIEKPLLHDTLICAINELLGRVRA